MSPWHILCLWHWCSAHSTWNVIHFFSSDVKKGRVDTRSYKLCFTYSRITSAAFSVNCKIPPEKKHFNYWRNVRKGTTAHIPQHVEMVNNWRHSINCVWWIPNVQHAFPVANLDRVSQKLWPRPILRRNEREPPWRIVCFPYCQKNDWINY